MSKFKTSGLIILTLSILIAACSKDEKSQAMVESQPSAAVAPPSEAERNPTNVHEMFTAARYIATNAEHFPLIGNAQKFTGTLLDEAVIKALAETTDAKQNMYWPLLLSLQGYQVIPSYGLSSSVGKFLFLNATSADNETHYGVAINLNTKKVTIGMSQYGDTSIAGDNLDAAALWSNNAYLAISESDKSDFFKASAPLSRNLKAMAVGYLYALESISTNTAKRQLAKKKLETQLAQNSNNGGDSMRYVGETLMYPKGASQDALRAVVPAIECTGLKDIDGASCTARASLLQHALLRGLPGTCIENKEIVAVFYANKLKSLGCSIDSLVSDKIFELHTNKYGRPMEDSVSVAGMRILYMEWKVGQDYVLLSSYQGNNFYGKPLNNFDIKIDTSPSLPLNK